MSRGFPFSDEEIALVRENSWMPASDLARKLGRKPASIKNLRYRLKNPTFEVRKSRPRSDPADYDTRPSGWYREHVGTLLTHYADAYDTWKHYHRYVEVIHVRSSHDGWTDLLCRRDAEAP